MISQQKATINQQKQDIDEHKNIIKKLERAVQHLYKEDYNLEDIDDWTKISVITAVESIPTKHSKKSIRTKHSKMQKRGFVGLPGWGVTKDYL